ncbi:MAG: hypothetical protein ACK5QT_06720 [Oligoflexia bacterium]
MISRGDSKNLSTLLKPDQLQKKLEDRGSAQLKLPGTRGAGLLTSLRPPPPPKKLLSPVTPVAPVAKELTLPGLKFAPEPERSSGHAASFFTPTLVAIAERICESLVREPQKILQLNPTRREAICKHLEVLSDEPPATAKSSQERLKRWLESSAALNPSSPLSRYFKEVALLALSESILLKSWSDRGIRKWKREDLQDLNATLHGALKTHLPMDREGWQFTRPNLYSWYKLPAEIQETLWKEFAHWRMVEEGPELLIALAQRLLSAPPSLEFHSPLLSYDEQVYRALWRALSGSLADETPDHSRKHWAFSPTLRDGSVVRASSPSVGWYGFEQDAFWLFIAELSLLWFGPSAPPFWAVGSGLEALARDQLSLGLGAVSKPSLFQRISEMQACDFAWVSEEQTLRGSSRSPAATRFREAVEQNPMLKRLRSGGTSLGHLQACVSISKLRPGGMLWWLREEPLHASDGAEALQYLLDRGRLVAEWDLTGIQIQCPSLSGKKTLPRALSLWVRDVDAHRRHAHQPLRIQVRGILRSHIELEPLLEDILRVLQDESHAPTRASWKLLVQKSPQPQREWANHWPEPVQEQALEFLEKIRCGSKPLASIGTVRPGDGTSLALKTNLLLQGAPRGFALKQVQIKREGRTVRRLSCEPLGFGRSDVASSASDVSDFVVLLGDESLSAPTRAYLESEVAAFWLDQKVEIRNNRWVLREQDIKLIPIPSILLNRASLRASSGFAAPLPGDWERLASLLTIQPRAILDALQNLQMDQFEIRAELFVRASRMHEELRVTRARLGESVTAQGKILWRNLIHRCDPSEIGPITLHPEILIQAPSGGIPLKSPMTRIQRSQQGRWKLQLATEMGQVVTLEFGHRMIFEAVADQIEALPTPTWSEIVELVRAPRRLDVIESRAADLLRMSGEQEMLGTDLERILEATLPALF